MLSRCSAGEEVAARQSRDQTGEVSRKDAKIDVKIAKNNLAEKQILRVCFTKFFGTILN